MIYKEISLGETMKNTQKMRNICLKLVLLALFYIASEAYAITGDNNLDGIISYEEKGELVAMIQTRLRELDYFYFKPTGSFRAMTREAVIAFQKNQELDSGAVVIADGTV
ncbi:MAG TPA: peptidoglycan-binding domain-containing protein, partial [Clostridia bacterium]|nr:peptidoglycan-binding domain-containing protein [Clostridia bacterium]